MSDDRISATEVMEDLDYLVNEWKVGRLSAETATARARHVLALVRPAPPSAREGGDDHGA